MTTAFNYNSFFNKFILVEGGDSISTVVARLSDDDFNELANECGIREGKHVDVSFDTGVSRPYGLTSLANFKDMAGIVYGEILNAAAKYEEIPDASMSIGLKDGYYHVYVYYVKTYSREERERLVVEVLGRRKGKIIAKRNRPPKAPKVPQVKTMRINGVEYILTPKV
jgi:hypothetical protein